MTKERRLLHNFIYNWSNLNDAIGKNNFPQIAAFCARNSKEYEVRQWKCVVLKSAKYEDKVSPLLNMERMLRDNATQLTEIVYIVSSMVCIHWENIMTL